MGKTGFDGVTSLLAHPLFLLGLIIRLALIAGLAPSAVTAWYAPFLHHSVATPSLDPWTAWLAHGGTPVAFPYGYAMWLLFLPGSALAQALGLPVAWGYSATLLGADLGLLFTLRHLVPARPPLLLWIYWLSPIVILATYALGFNDVVPTLLLTLALLALRHLAMVRAGALVAAAISAKLSMVVPLPFMLVYLFNNKALRQHLPAFGQGLSLGALVLGTPFLLSPAALRMLAGNPEMGKIYQLAFPLDASVSIYLVPLLYLVVLYGAWRVRRLNFGLFHATTGVALLCLVLLTPAAPGWFIWCLPFLALYQAQSDRTAIVLVSTFSGLYALGTLMVTTLIPAYGAPLDFQAWLLAVNGQGSRLPSLFHTTMTAIGLIVTLRVWREAISHSDFFRFSRKPFVVGIAGDSGAGKDTLADALTGLFGTHSVSRLSGDDYHLWDRQKPLWQVMTHLNPMANNLEAFAQDLITLSKGKPIQMRHYDHQTGKMGRPLRLSSNDFILVSGLHALFSPLLRECYDLAIYLDMEEGLRRHLKIRRDVHERGHARARVQAALMARAEDAQRFIRPQAAHADLLFALTPIRPFDLERETEVSHPPLKLTVRTRQGFHDLALNRVLVGICGLHVDRLPQQDGQAAALTIEGEIAAEDIAVAARLLCPEVFEFLDTAPRWHDGMLGLMQLITLSHIQQALSRRTLA